MNERLTGKKAGGAPGSSQSSGAEDALLNSTGLQQNRAIAHTHTHTAAQSLNRFLNRRLSLELSLGGEAPSHPRRPRGTGTKRSDAPAKPLPLTAARISGARRGRVAPLAVQTWELQLARLLGHAVIGFPRRKRPPVTGERFVKFTDPQSSSCRT